MIIRVTMVVMAMVVPVVVMPMVVVGAAGTADMVGVVVRRVIVMRMPRRIGQRFGLQPAGDIRRLAAGIVKAAGEEIRAGSVRLVGEDHRRTRLSAFNSASNRSTTPAPARSALVMTIRSATAACFTASSCAASVATPLTASTAVTTPSSR